MLPAPPLSEQPIADPTQLVAPTVKPRSIKQFFLTSSARLAIGAGIFGVMGIVAWLARNELATTGLNAFLASKGIASDVTIENLQLDAAQISDLRLGPVDKPTLIARKSILKWRIDSKARLVIIERIQIDGAQVRLGVGADGKPNFGALAPFLKPSSGPKRSVVNNVTLSNGVVLLDTPMGEATARLNVKGGEATGWTGRADITPPRTMMATPPLVLADFKPIPVGFSIRQNPKSGPDTPATTLIGFAVRPNGQGLTYQGYDMVGLVGDVTGQVTIAQGQAIRVDTRPITLKLASAGGSDFRMIGLDITTNPIFWSQDGAWQTTGWGNIVANANFKGLVASKPRLTAGPTRLVFGAARAQSGKIQLDYQGDVQNVSGPVSGRRLVAQGNVTTTLKDLTKLAEANLVGKIQVSGAGFVIPASLRSNLAATTPPPVLSALAGTVSGSGTFTYSVTPGQTQVNLAGPLTLSSSSGARAAWAIDGRGGAPGLIVKNRPNGTVDISGLGSGQVSIDVPGLVGLAGQIDGASFGPTGWALLGRNMTVQSLALMPGLDARARLARFSFAAPSNGQLGGSGAGLVELSTNRNAQGQGNASLTFDVRATPSALSGTLQGPFEGLGGALGLGGYGARDGRLSLAGSAKRTASSWQIDARGNVGARSLGINAVNVIAPTATVTAVGQLTPTGTISGRTTISASAARVQPTTMGSQSTGSALRADATATLGGTLANLQVAGTLKAVLGTGTFGDLRTDAGINETRFTGLIGRDLTRLSGSHVTQFSRLSRVGGPLADGIEVAGIRASGPFDVQTGRQGQGSPFWNGRLSTTGTSATSAISLDAKSVRAGSTRLTNVRLAGPTAFASNGVASQSNARLNLAAQTLSMGDLRLTGLVASAPITATSAGGSWQASGDLTMTTDKLTSGDTKLNGVVASGPVSVTANAAQQIRVASRRCLDFNAASGTFPGDASIGTLSGKLCPDEQGQLAVVTKSVPRLFATTQLEPFAIQIGELASGQRVDLGDISGKIATKPDGSLGVQMLATQFGLSLILPDGATAQIKANEAALDIGTGSNGIALKGRIGRVSSIGLPILLSGGATTDLIAGAQGLTGTFNFDDIIVKDGDKSLRFGELRLVGSGTLAGNQVSILSDVLEPASEIKMATVMLSHNIAAGSGNLDMTARDLLFSPMPVANRPGLDIVTLIPPLRGVVSDLVGVVNASANIAWSRSSPLVSRANVETKGLDFATTLGPISGLAGDINLDDILLVRTAGRQTIKVGLFDPGLPVANGTVQFALPGNNTLRLEDASWPFAEGQLSVRPATWAFRDGDQSFAIDVNDVDLAKLLRLTEVPNLEIDGKVSGVFPIEVRNGNVEIVGGRLKAREGGGVIRYTGSNLVSPPPPPPGFWQRQRERLFGKAVLGGADLAAAALRALEYKILEITVDGRITGELQMGVILEGANQQVLSGQPFKFNVKMNVPVGQLIENLNRLNNSGSSPEVLEEIDRVLREEAATKATTPPAPTLAPTPALPPVLPSPAAPTTPSPEPPVPSPAP